MAGTKQARHCRDCNTRLYLKYFTMKDEITRQRYYVCLFCGWNLHAQPRREVMIGARLKYD